MEILKRIVRRYDVILIQEIRDSTETAILDLLAMINEGASTYYSMVQSERLGRTSSKEQYAYLYRNDLYVTDEFVFNDLSDIFEREPYIVRFEAPGKHVTDFTLVGLHTKPTDAVAELDGLVPVIAQIKDRFSENPTENIMILGDLNADCSYVTNTEKAALALRKTPEYHWLINDDDDTTISLTTSCAYDRFILTSPGLFDYGRSTSIFHFDQEYGLTNEFALEVSDHYPIEIEFTQNLTPKLTPTLTQTKTKPEGYMIGSFNIQIFGDTKASKADVMEVLSKIIQRYDIIFIQEIRDVSGDAIQKLLRLTNEEGPRQYGVVVSERLGRSNSKEQYAYMYRLYTTSVTYAYVFDDTEDVFEREPYIVEFSSQSAAVPKFVLAGIHVKPSDALAELDALAQVHTDITNRLNTDEVVFMGDFNADCSYLNAGERDALVLKSNDYYWPIGADVDTTVSNSNCAYDRFIFVSSSEMRIDLKTCSAKPFLFDKEYSLSSELALKVSDHYPIEIEFKQNLTPKLTPTLTKTETNPKGYMIGSFNIRIFGDTKASKADVMEVLSKIIQRYDIIFIQEIRDATGDAIEKLLSLTNSEGPEQYALVVSERLGRSNSKEHYAYMYRLSTTKVTYAYVFDDTEDIFEREPYIVEFSAENAAVSKFVLAGIHVKPSDALAELNALAQVKADITNRLNTDEVVFMGDFNADCSYLNAGERDALVLKSSDYYWPIGADVDTTVSKSNCAYDRFIFVSSSEMRINLKPGSAKPFLFDQEYSLSSELALKVSDHYPIEIEFTQNLAPNLAPTLTQTETKPEGYMIGSFNIQIFGDTKASKADVMEVLSKIIQRYDIIFIQEIRDATGDAIEKLLSLTNSEGPEQYAVVVSERLGRSNSKEQYAYMYRLSTTKVTYAYVFDDTEDIFEREPYIVEFSAENAAVPQFVLAGIHVKPSDALAELNALAQVKTDIINRLNTDEVVFMGDFNADCSYLNAGERDALVLKSSDYYWPIGADVDTTVSNSNCAYDRFIFVNSSEMRTYLKAGSAKPFLFDKEYSLSRELALAISDHYPIEMEMYREGQVVDPVRRNENFEDMIISKLLKLLF
ncbi:unnamed protein product [Owenia fusiformis]|uniref:Endonuclease/exonuclease/phosphatase domain-containing protein n=1 Tax=Owenia fusiformis TaxID=6347 RepID=A0A8J1TGN3_OWEFU|nr:unnamed protein product [Owenia fusiformis]